MKKIIPLLVLLSACATKIKTSHDAAPVDTSGAAAVSKLLTTYYDDMSRRDWVAFRLHFWDHATITTAWVQPGDSTERVDVTTIDDFIRETTAGPDSQPIFDERMIGSNIKVKGNLCEAWIDYEAKFGKPDSLIRWKGTDVFTLMRLRDEWKIVSLAFEVDH